MSEGYVGMTGQWVKALAVEAFLMGCSDKRSALSSMDKKPQTALSAESDFAHWKKENSNFKLIRWWRVQVLMSTN